MSDEEDKRRQLEAIESLTEREEISEDVRAMARRAVEILREELDE